MSSKARPSAAKKRLKVAIDGDGVITAIYSDELVEAGLLSLGHCSIARASNVEPHPWGGWAAFMVNGPVLTASATSTFKLRSEALAAEIAYLEERLFT